MTNLTNKYWELCSLQHHLDDMSHGLIIYADKLKIYDTDNVSFDIRNRAEIIATEARLDSFEIMEQSKQIHKVIKDLEEQIKLFEITLIKAKKAYLKSQEINTKIIIAIEDLL